MVAFASNVLPNLVDWTRSMDPDGAVAEIAYLLAQTNAIHKDMIYQEGNLPLGHKITANVGLPQGTWRGANQGVASSKPLSAQYQFAIGELTAYSMVDKTLANLGGNVNRYRYYQDMTHIEGMNQQIAAALFYSNEAVTPQQFTGFARYYNTLSQTTAASARNVIDGGGSGSNNASIWVVGWGDAQNYAIFPKGMPAGLQYEDKGDTTPLYDTNGNRFEGYTSYFAWRIGLAIANWQYNVRIANLDTTTAGLLGTSPPDIYVMLAEAVNLFPTFTLRASGITENDAPGDPSPGILPAIYVNRTVRTQMDVQGMRDKNVLLSIEDYAGQVTEHFRGVPVRVVDQLLNTETAVA